MTPLDVGTSQSVRAGLWLRDAALPLWSGAGIDPGTGGAVEALDHEGRPLLALDRRIRIHPRQAYVFAGAGQDLGRGDYLALSESLLAHGLAQRSPEGWLPARTSPDGRTSDHHNALYDLAFFVLAGAELTRAGRPQPELWSWLLEALDQLRDRNGRGWFETRHGATSEPRTQNSHMHLFEAATLAAEATGDAAWSEVREECLDLFRTVFLGPEGEVREFFDNDWRPVAEGQRVEPGHGAEWVYLLHRYGQLAGRDSGVDLDRMFGHIISWRDVSGFLPDAAALPGAAGPIRGVDTRRLWPQTELLKACRVQTARGRTLSPDLDPDAILRAMFRDYLEMPAVGGWYDQRSQTGTLVSQNMPTSSLYHLFVAFRDFLPQPPGRQPQGR